MLPMKQIPWESFLSAVGNLLSLAFFLTFTHGVDVNEFCKSSLKGQLEIVELDSVKIDDLSTKFTYLKRDY